MLILGHIPDLSLIIFLDVPYSELTAFLETLPDSQFSGSSQFSWYHGYERSRLDTVVTGSYSGAWVAAGQFIGQFIQADLGAVRRVEKVATQGRPDFDHWVTSYRFAYSVDGLTYHFILSNTGSEQIFAGNSDRDTVVENTFDMAVAARYVRVYPQTWHTGLSIRWEVYGRDIGETVYIFELSLVGYMLALVVKMFT